MCVRLCVCVCVCAWSGGLYEVHNPVNNSHGHSFERKKNVQVIQGGECRFREIYEPVSQVYSVGRGGWGGAAGKWLFYDAENKRGSHPLMCYTYDRTKCSFSSLHVTLLLKLLRRKISAEFKIRHRGSRDLINILEYRG